MRREALIALLVIGDGRDALRKATLASFNEQTGKLLSPTSEGGSITRVVGVDDRAHELGFCGAIQEGWRLLREHDDFDYVFHLEEDWRFDRTVDLEAIADLLDSKPTLAQVAFRRGPVAPAEKRAGGVVEMWPDEYQDRALILEPVGERNRIVRWLEHSLYFTTNPCLYRRSLIERFSWPDGPACEEAFTRELVASEWRFALWGERSDAPWITHTGTTRTGTGY